MQEYWHALTLPLVGFLAYTFVIITYRFPIGQVGVILGLFALAIEGRRLVVPPFLRWMAASTIWAALTLLWSTYPAVSFTALETPLKLTVITLLGVNAIRSRRELVIFLVFAIGCFAAYPIRGTVLNYLNGITVGDRAAWNSALSNPNALAAATLLPITASVMLLALFRSLWIRMALGAVLLSCAIVMLMTQSRTGFLALVAFGAILLLRSRKRIRSAVLIGLAVAAVLIVAPRSVWHRVSGMVLLTDTRTIADADEEGSAAQRFEIAKTALRIVVDHPVLGTGFGTYPLVNEQYSPSVGRMDTHNTFLHVLAEQGIIGLALFCGILLSALLASRRSRRAADIGRADAAHLSLVASAGLIAFLVAAALNTYDQFPYLHFLLLVVYATSRDAPPPYLAPHARGRPSRARRPLGGVA
jgi:probable O-glycosylation ligase (exosortase A-associated)